MGILQRAFQLELERAIHELDAVSDAAVVDFGRPIAENRTLRLVSARQTASRSPQIRLAASA